MTRSARRLVLAATALAAVLLAGAGWQMQRTQARMQAETERSLLRIALQRQAGLAAQATGAGISMQRPQIRPLPLSARKRRAATGDLHAYLHRCTSCHATPDPGMHAAGEWPAVVERMDGWMRAAGLLPMEPAERAAVLRYLRGPSAPD